MKAYTSAERREWIGHYYEQGENAAETCRAFGIPRSTFYRWFRRYDADKPSKPLRSRSKRPKHKRKKTWTQEDLQIVAEMDATARTSLTKMTARLNRLGLPWSRSTVARMIARVRRWCPICRKKGRHDRFTHSMKHWQRQWEQYFKELARLEEEMRHRARLYQSGHKQPMPE